MKWKQIFKTRLIPCALLLVMMMSMLPAFAFAVGEDDTAGQETTAEAIPPAVDVDVHLRKAEDLKSLAIRCQVESYSEGLIVSLDQDINLEGITFMPIPSFSGTFLGNGHTISNYTCASNGSHQGLFRYLRAKGSVINLRVTGTVSPSGSRCAVGGIVGTNYGFVGNCQFNGTVSGLLNTGGIAGENYGIVKDCVAEGSVSAKHFVGGIVGYNEGSIGYCSNIAAINNEVFEEALSLESLELDDILGVQTLSDAQIDTVSDVGGITGINTGIVKACENTAAVGYQHYGYNVGGIAGRQSGYLTECVNSGNILGRKDVGGIVGQMAPYLILESSSSVSDELNAVQSSTNTALHNLDSNSAIVGDSLADTAVYGVAISDRYYDTSGVIDKAQNGTLTEDDVLNGAKNDKDKKDTSSASDWLVDKSQTATDKVGEYGEIIGEETAGNVISGDLTDADKENLTNAAEHGISNIADSIEKKQQEKAAEAAADQERDRNINNAINSSLSLGNNLTSTIDQLTNDLAGVSEHYNKILSMIANALSGNYELTILNDISDQDTDAMKDGKVENCRNSGTVSADSGVGGIVGTMDTELDFDIEKILSATSSDTVELSSSTYYCRNIVTGCINDGIVEGKKELVGGIVGLNVIGNILLSQNYGDIIGSGDYYGGIAGKSNCAVRKCFSMCSLEGSSYIGGVAGQGKVIESSSTIVTADTGAACSGSIAGWVDFSDKSTHIANNYFVNDEMGGIDGISYDGVCERVSYEQLLTMHALPDEFRALTLTFVADGEVVDTISFSYGDSLKESDIPAVPDKNGISGVWEPFDYENLCRSETVEAQYNPRQTVVASEAAREGSPLSLVLAEGTFAQNTTLSLTNYIGDERLPFCGKTATTVTVQGTNPNLKNYTVRWNTDGKRAKVYLLQDGAWHRISSHRDGRYQVFHCAGKSNTICIMDDSLYFLSRDILSVWIGLGLMILIWVLLNRKYHIWANIKRISNNMTPRGKRVRMAHEPASDQPQTPSIPDIPVTSN